MFRNTGSAEARGSRRTSSRATPPVGLLLPALLVVGCGGPATPPAPPTSPPAKIAIVHPQRAALKRVVEQPGTVRAWEEAPLVAKVAGYVRRIHADIGDRVAGPKFDSDGNETTPGQVLAELAVPELEEEARQKEAFVKQAQAEEALARAAKKTAQAAVTAAVAAEEEATAAVGKADALEQRWQSEAKRVAGLVASRVLDEQTRDETNHQLKAATAARAEARAHLAEAAAATEKSRLSAEQAAAAETAASARLEVARADARRLVALVGYTRVRAPFDGVVIRRAVDPGHYLDPARTGPIFTVARDDRLRVAVDVPESDAGLVRAGPDGSPAVVTLPALGGELAGRVARVSWGLDPGSRTLRAEVDLDNRDGRFRPGLYATARITTELPAAFVMPSAAIARQGESTVCFRAVDGKALRTVVQTGAADGTRTQALRWQQADGTWRPFDGTEAVATPAAALVDGQALPAE
jgi:multidrug efflux pump subunit AcrA (membrane-fusion protein)